MQVINGIINVTKESIARARVRKRATANYSTIYSPPGGARFKTSVCNQVGLGYQIGRKAKDRQYQKSHMEPAFLSGSLFILCFHRESSQVAITVPPASLAVSLVSTWASPSPGTSRARARRRAGSGSERSGKPSRLIEATRLKAASAVFF